MHVLEGIDGLKRLPPGCALSIGNFDGMHLGHARIIQTLKRLGQGAPLAVATFEPHPLTVLRPNLAPPRLTTPRRKQQLLADAGVEYLIILPPTREVLELTAEQFWSVIVEHTRPRVLVEGSSFNFGKDRGGTIAKLRQWVVGTGINLHIVDAVEVTLQNLHIATVSSSLIRWLISYGRMKDAALCLGRPYRLIGPVKKGYGRGRQLGVPTANIDCPDQLVPDDGVYAARCTIDGKTWPVALSIGTSPTFQAQHQVEAHLIGFSGDLYERTLDIEVLDWIRAQYKFQGVEPLKQQIARDLQLAGAV